jgi:hypothetical protein
MTLNVSVARSAAIKQDACCLNRIHWIVLANSLTHQTFIHQFTQTKDIVDQQFQCQLNVPGAQSFKALCVNGRGECWTSNLVNINVT